MNYKTKSGYFLLFFVCFMYSNSIKASAPKIKGVIEFFKQLDKDSLMRMAPEEKKRLNVIIASLLLLNARDESSVIFKELKRINEEINQANKNL